MAWLFGGGGAGASKVAPAAMNSAAPAMASAAPAAMQSAAPAVVSASPAAGAVGASNVPIAGLYGAEQLPSVGATGVQPLATNINPAPVAYGPTGNMIEPGAATPVRSASGNEVISAINGKPIPDERFGGREIVSKFKSDPYAAPPYADPDARFRTDGVTATYDKTGEPVKRPGRVWTEPSAEDLRAMTPEGRAAKAQASPDKKSWGKDILSALSKVEQGAEKVLEKIVMNPATKTVLKLGSAMSQADQPWRAPWQAEFGQQTRESNKAISSTLLDRIMSEGGATKRTGMTVEGQKNVAKTNQEDQTARWIASQAGLTERASAKERAAMQRTQAEQAAMDRRHKESEARKERMAGAKEGSSKPSSPTQVSAEVRQLLVDYSNTDSPVLRKELAAQYKALTGRDIQDDEEAQGGGTSWADIIMGMSPLAGAIGTAMQVRKSGKKTTADSFFK